MCYFVEINLPRIDLERRFGVKMPEDPRYTPGFFHSAFDRPFLPVITNNNPGLIQLFRWGLIPSWVKTEEDAKKILSGTYNARSETIWEKPSFRFSAKNRRCMVPAHGFFEWHTAGKRKILYYIKRKDNKPFAFAGLFDIWTNRDSGEIQNTFSIITTRANQLLESIHNLKKRMPAILSPEVEKEWISNSLSVNELAELLQPLPDDQLIAWPVDSNKLKKGIDISDPSIIQAWETDPGISF